MGTTFLQSSGRALLLLHAASAIVLVGAVSHHALVALGYMRGVYKIALGRIYAASVAAFYALTYLVGGLVYPTYRYQIRELVFDRQAVWASNLFDVKESLASIGLPLAVGAFVLSRVMKPEEDRGAAVGYAVLVCGVTVTVWFDVLSGLLVTMAKGV